MTSKRASPFFPAATGCGRRTWRPLPAVGITRIKVFERPRVAIISTGNEIVPADTVPGPGQIRDSNSYNLEGLITQAGGVPVKKGIIPDDYARLRETLEAASGDCRPRADDRRQFRGNRGFDGESDQ